MSYQSMMYKELGFYEKERRKDTLKRMKDERNEKRRRKLGINKVTDKELDLLHKQS